MHRNTVADKVNFWPFFLEEHVELIPKECSLLEAGLSHCVCGPCHRGVKNVTPRKKKIKLL